MKENLPEKYNKKSRSEIDWRRYLELTRKVHEIHPEMPADEAWNRILEKNEYIKDHPAMNERVKKTQERLMQRNGLNPENWMFYDAVQPKDTKNMMFTEEDMEGIAGNFPRGFEFFAAPGQLITDYDPVSENTTMHFNENYWTIYIKRNDYPQVESSE